MMDLDMTGLDHTRDQIVEIATIVTDDELAIVAEGPDLVIGQPPEVLAAMEPVVMEMHTRSGLFDAARTSTITLAEAGEATLAFIREHAPEPRQQIAKKTVLVLRVAPGIARDVLEEK